MTYSIFDSTGNLVDSFDDRAAALKCLVLTDQPGSGSASEAVLVAQREDDDTIYEITHGSSAPLTA
jgi:hypothetical protein